MSQLTGDEVSDSADSDYEKSHQVKEDTIEYCSEADCFDDTDTEDDSAEWSEED